MNRREIMRSTGDEEGNSMRRPPGNGWTLVELLIAVAVLSILATIAVTQFASYRTRTFNVVAESDLANMRLIEQAMLVEFEDYGGAAATAMDITFVGADTGTTVYLRLSSGVYAGAKVLPSGGRNISYAGVTKHTRGNYAYGTEPESPATYRKTMADGTTLQDSDIPDATLGVDFTSPWQ